MANKNVPIAIPLDQLCDLGLITSWNSGLDLVWEITEKGKERVEGLLSLCATELELHD
ncbi:hypothetical protein [Bacteriophage Eos]|nr:hypothetical protein [Bacteriophage Eos]